MIMSQRVANRTTEFTEVATVNFVLSGSEVDAVVLTGDTTVSGTP